MIEAMGHRLPIVAAKTAVNEEICGDAALYYSPLDPKDACSKIEQALNPSTRERLRRKWCSALERVRLELDQIRQGFHPTRRQGLLSMRTCTQLVFGAGGLHRIMLASARQRLLHRAFDLGFRSFDVAPAYGNGLNELELEEAFSGVRANIAITTKFGIPIDAYGERYRVSFPLVRAARKYLRSGYGAEYTRRTFSGPAMAESLHGSLRRLRSDYVDRLLIHEPLAPLSSGLMCELAEHADRLKAQGKILSFGICGSTSSVRALLDQPCIEAVQMPLWDTVDEFHVRSKRHIVYGVYRCYRRRPAPAADTFIDYVAAFRREYDGLEFILSSISSKTLTTFRALFS